jgi:hypothetical protein
MKEMQCNEKKIREIQDKAQLPLKPSHRESKHQVPPPPPQRSKSRSIKAFCENVSQLSLCVNVFHHYVSFLNMVSQKVVSHFDVFCSPMEDRILGETYGTGVITHEGYTLVV